MKKETIQVIVEYEIEYTSGSDLCRLYALRSAKGLPMVDGGQLIAGEYKVTRQMVKVENENN